MVWNKNPYMQALLRLAHPSVRSDEAATQFISNSVLSTARPPAPFREAAADLQRQPCGFIYDRTSGLVFLGTWGESERIAAALMQLHHMHAPANWKRAQDMMEKQHEPLVAEYLEEGFGFIGSPPVAANDRWMLHAGQDVLLSAQEKLSLGEMVILGR